MTHWDIYKTTTLNLDVKRMFKGNRLISNLERHGAADLTRRGPQHDPTTRRAA